jgi:hypothetical protein
MINEAIVIDASSYTMNRFAHTKSKSVSIVVTMGIQPMNAKRNILSTSCISGPHHSRVGSSNTLSTLDESPSLSYFDLNFLAEFNNSPSYHRASCTPSINDPNEGYNSFYLPIIILDSLSHDTDTSYAEPTSLVYQLDSLECAEVLLEPTPTAPKSR